MGSFLLPWLFPFEDGSVEDWLLQQCVVITFYGVGELGFEEFVTLEEIADDWYFGLYDSIETFRSLLE